MTPEEIEDAVASCECPPYEFKVLAVPAYSYLQVQWSDRLGVHKGRKWLLSEHMTKNEIVQTCFLGVMTIMEHELRETFRYRGRRIFGPHFSPDALWSMAKVSALDLRVDPT